MRLACYLISLLLTACSIDSVIMGAYDNREYIAGNLKRPMKVSQAKKTFLLESSDIFYPNGLPADPSALPDLSQNELNKLERLLERVSKRVSRTLKKHKNFLLKHDAALNLNAARIRRITILNQGQSVAATDQEGTIYLDAKVIQSIYRSTLLAVLTSEGANNSFFSIFFGREPELDDLENMDPESRAFAKFQAFKNKLEGLSSVLLLSDIGAFTAGAGSDTLTKEAGFSDRFLSGAQSLFEQRMKDARLMSQSRALERAFMGSVEFLVAHEVSHIALNHFPLSADCEEAQYREIAADSQAVLINTLTQFDLAPQLTYRSNNEGGYNVKGAFWSPTSSHLLFFTYAYDFAEFDGAFSHIAGCKYVDKTKRAVFSYRIGKMLEEILDSARRSEAYRKSRSRKLREQIADEPFQEAFEVLIKEIEDEEKSKFLPPMDFVMSNKDLLGDLFNTYYHSRN